ncbi:MAG: heparinase II/III family protein, partial [Oscillospiraceae bacterium]|nr:heparinase II/III family protein [Oscillospiraceae bacterium]
MLRDIFAKMQRAQIHGNFGLAQNTLTKAAIVLDDGNDTQKMIDFVMRPGVVDDAYTNYPGGNVLPQIMNVVDRDGNGNESSQGYNKHWPVNLLEMAQNLNDYRGVQAEYDILENPKFIKMLKLGAKTVLTGTQGPNVGDNGPTAGRGAGLIPELYLAGFRATKDTEFAQLLYFASGGSTDGIHYDIFTRNPENVQTEIEKAVELHGEFDISASTIETGYGFAALRGGLRFETASSSVMSDTTRDVWMYFGGGQTSHKHYDGLNIGIEAFGMNMSPDLGYPAETGTNDVRNEWVAGTVSHNTVVVNDEPQVKTAAAGTPLHFDGNGEVKVIDVEMPKAYPTYVNKYRRTLISVDVDDTVSYTVDFFRISGGDEHVYSFHAQAKETDVEGVALVSQPMGTYAGADVPYGDTEYSAKSDSGYNWLENVERAKNPGTGTFTADFKVENLRPTLSLKKYDWHLRMTMLNDFNLSEVALADGRPPESGTNPESFDYILARRSGKRLDTLFTTVFEPYIGRSAVKNLERVAVTRADRKPMREEEPCAAIKVTLECGRVDYIVYAANKSVTYNVDGVFDFRGTVGVYTVSESNINAEPERTYILDGTKIGDKVYQSTGISGKVVDFTDIPAFENYIMLETYDEVNTDAIIGSLINVENDGEENGAYRITSAEKTGNILTVGIGDVTLIRGYKDVYNRDKGYHFNIENGQRATIALSAYESSAPVIEQAEDTTVSAGNTIKIPISAICEPGRKLTFIGTVLPRGMSIDRASGMLSWKPDPSQVGENHVAITADDGMLSSTMRFTVTVYGSTTSVPS